LVIPRPWCCLSSFQSLRRPPRSTSPSSETTVSDTIPTRQVANLVRSWQSLFVITLGDNKLSRRLAATIDRHIGQFYHEFISPYKGRYGFRRGSPIRFFPCLGNMTG